MNISEFLRKREEEVKWFHLNGFANGDPHSNGEFNTVVFLSEFYDLFVDIGANIGEFSKKVLTDNPEKAVIAFEPNPYLYDDLADLVEENNLVYGVALSDVKGEMFLHIHPEDSGTSSLFSRTDMMPSFTSVMKKVKVSVDKFDNYKKEISERSKIGVFVKIDTEGAELSIIKGGEDLFTIDIPIIIMFEYSIGWKESNSTLNEAFHVLDKLGFKMFRVTPLGLEHIKFFTINMENYEYCNYLVVKNLDLEDHFQSRTILSLQGISFFIPFEFQ